ncbi:MAG: hypothetical protein ACKO2G_06795 [Verrucomicrobiales bacterium]
MKSRRRHLALVLALATGLSGVLTFTGCESLRGAGKKKVPVLVVPPELALPGTMVVYMPKIVSAAKQQSGDPIYGNWANALMGYVDESTFVQTILDRGRILNSSTHLSSKSIPSSDYSVLLVGAEGRAVHVQEPWQSTQLFLMVDEYLRGKASLKNLPPGSEAVRVTTKRLEEKKEQPDDLAPAPEGNPPAPAAKPEEKSEG